MIASTIALTLVSALVAGACTVAALSLYRSETADRWYHALAFVACVMTGGFAGLFTFAGVAFQLSRLN